jgi:hypothetical protein
LRSRRASAISSCRCGTDAQPAGGVALRAATKHDLKSTLRLPVSLKRALVRSERCGLARSTEGSRERRWRQRALLPSAQRHLCFSLCHAFEAPPLARQRRAGGQVFSRARLRLDSGSRRIVEDQCAAQPSCLSGERRVVRPDQLLRMIDEPGEQPGRRDGVHGPEYCYVYDGNVGICRPCTPEEEVQSD